MEDYFAYCVLSVVVILFFYYGYKDDYNRSPKGFIRTLLGVTIEGVGFFLGAIGISKFINKLNKDNEK